MPAVKRARLWNTMQHKKSRTWPKSHVSLLNCSASCHSTAWRTSSCGRCMLVPAVPSTWNILSFAWLSPWFRDCLYLNAASPETLYLKKSLACICSHSVTLRDSALLYFSSLRLAFSEMILYLFLYVLPISSTKIQTIRGHGLHSSLQDRKTSSL